MLTRFKFGVEGRRTILESLNLGGDGGEISLKAGEVILYRLEIFVTGDNGLV